MKPITKNIALQITVHFTMPERKPSAVDIFDLLSSSVEQTPDKSVSGTQRQELLSATKVKDLYPEGSIAINKYTCVGVQCKACIKVCPTNALYWTTNGIALTEDLCVHCQACVLVCMVDNCIKVTRKRDDGKTEQFSNSLDVIKLNNQINAQKRAQRIVDAFTSPEESSKKRSSLK